MITCQHCQKILDEEVTNGMVCPRCQGPILDPENMLKFGELVLKRQETLDKYEKWNRFGAWLRSPVSLWRRLRNLF